MKLLITLGALAGLTLFSDTANAQASIRNLCFTQKDALTIVEGEIKTSTPCWTASARKKAGNDADPSELLLEITADRKPGPCAQVISWIKFRHQEKGLKMLESTSVSYRTASINAKKGDSKPEEQK